MQTLLLISLAFIVGRYISNLFSDKKDVNVAAGIPAKLDKYKNVKYYSEGQELPYPFHYEYKIIVNAMEGSWIYDEEHQELVNQNHNAPVLDREIKIPTLGTFTYTFNHVFLAHSFLKEQQEYLGNLN